MSLKHAKAMSKEHVGSQGCFGFQSEVLAPEACGSTGFGVTLGCTPVCLSFRVPFFRKG